MCTWNPIKPLMIIWSSQYHYVWWIIHHNDGHFKTFFENLLMVKIFVFFFPTSQPVGQLSFICNRSRSKPDSPSRPFSVHRRTFPRFVRDTLYAQRYRYRSCVPRAYPLQSIIIIIMRAPPGCIIMRVYNGPSAPWESGGFRVLQKIFTTCAAVFLGRISAGVRAHTLAFRSGLSSAFVAPRRPYTYSDIRVRANLFLCNIHPSLYIYIIFRT